MKFDALFTARKPSLTHPESLMLMRTVFCLLAMFASLPTHAAPADCPPFTVMPTFEMPDAAQRKGLPEMRDYEFHDFPRSNAEPVRIKGRSCFGKLVLRQGMKEPAPQEIVIFHKRAIEAAGGKVLLQDNCQVVGMLTRNGQESWLHAGCEGGWGSAYNVWVVEKAPVKLTLTAPAAGDFRLLGHMPGYTVVKNEKADKSEQDFDVGPGVPAIKVQGRRQYLVYQATGRPQPAGDIEVTENYLAAVKARGGELLFQGDRDVTARFEEGGQVWVRVTSLFGEVTLTIVEEKGAAPVAPPKPDALKTALDKDGRVALYVNFDFAKASLKADAAPVIAQIVALLNANPNYKLSIEGHTDNIGGADANLKLSDARAATVVAELVKAGIAAGRLSSSGAGLSKPIASNDTSEGRAKNRRVELVKR
jgi:outer membrane protein OmpA-like peptidoglycan-associated protein